MIRSLVRLARPLLPLGLVVLVGCTEATATRDSAVFGPEGGALDTDFGFSLVVPAQAVKQDVEISATIDPVLGLQLEPFGLHFDEDVLLTLPAVDDGEGLTVAACCLAEHLETCVAPGERGMAAGHPWLPRVADRDGADAVVAVD